MQLEQLPPAPGDNSPKRSFPPSRSGFTESVSQDPASPTTDRSESAPGVTQNDAPRLREDSILRDLRGLDPTAIAKVLRPDGGATAIRDRALAYLNEQKSNHLDSQINIKLKAGFGPSPGNPDFPAFEDPKAWLSHIVAICSRRLEGITESTPSAVAYKQAQKAIVDFGNGIRDYHVGIFLNNTESSRLGFRMRYSEEPDGSRRYFVMPPRTPGEGATDALSGAEVLAIDGQPIDELVTSLMAGGVPEFINKENKDRSFATLLATIRVAALAMDVPTGSATVEFARNGQRTSAELPWDYRPETRPVPGSTASAESPLQLRAAQANAEVQAKSNKTNNVKPSCLQYDVRAPCWRSAPDATERAKRLVTARADAFGDNGLRNAILRRSQFHCENPLMKRMSAFEAEAPLATGHETGAKRSFLPRLGEPVVVSNGEESVTLESASDDLFDWYVYEEDGKRVGVVRIPTYSPTDDDPNSETFGQSTVDQSSERFGEIIETFNRAGCEALFIDQINNGGGNVAYGYSLLSHLTDKTLTLPQQSLLISDDDRAFAESTLAEVAALREVSPDLSEDELARSIFGETFSGNPVTAKTLANFENAQRFLIEEYDAGRNLGSNPTYIALISEIEPHPDPMRRFTGPQTIWVNQDSVSMAELTPAIAQDNGTAKITGVDTSGAGGLVETVDAGDNTFNVSEQSHTGSIGIRQIPPGSTQPELIEGIGVIPDKRVDFTTRDLQTGEYPDLVANLKNTIRQSMRQL